MSQAIIDFCEGLKTTLLDLEARLDKASETLAASAEEAQSEAKKHVDEAAAQLQAFKARAAKMAEVARAELPAHATGVGEKLKDFGVEAQVALNHALVLMAEGVAKSAEAASEALKEGGRRAHAFAEGAKHHTALTAPEQKKPG